METVAQEELFRILRVSTAGLLTPIKPTCSTCKARFSERKDTPLYQSTCPNRL